MGDTIEIIQGTATTVEVAGPTGPQGPQGPKGDPGDVSGSVAWDNVTGKPATFTPSAHTHELDELDASGAADGYVLTAVGDGTAAWEAATGGVTSVTGTAPIVSSGGTTPAISISVGTTAGTVAAGDDARLSDSRNPTAHAASHLGGIKAWIIATDEDLSGITEIVSIRADNAGTAGNSITISFDGVDNVSAAVATWNAANPSNAATVLQGASQIPDNGQSVTLTHGANAAADPIVAANLDSLLVAGTDTGGGEFADIRLKGKTFFGNASGNTGMLAEGNAPFHPPSTFGFTGVNESVTAYRPLGFTTGYYAQLVLNTDGKVGVGTSTPAEKLDVNGAIQASELKLSDNSNTQIATFVADANLTAARTYDLPDRSGELMLVGDAPASHTHGNITNDGLVGTTANLPLKTGTGGIVEAGVFGVNAGEFAEGNHTHADLHTRSHAITSTSDHTAGNHKVFYSNGSGEIVELALGNSGEVLTSNGASAAPSFAAASGGDTVSIDASAADVLTATSGAISADDGGTIDSADPFIKWDDTAGKLVYANPLSRPSGAFYVGLAPTTTALGTDAVNVQSNRTGATRVASGSRSVAVGHNSEASGNTSTGLGYNARGTGLYATAIGGESTATASFAIAIGEAVSANQQSAIAIGGYTAGGNATAVNAVGLNQNATLRGQLSTRPFQAVYWGGQTTNNTATVLNLDATATNRFTIAANTALAVDILLVARRSDTADKWLVARRFLGIRRDGSNNTSLIGSVQTLGTDQSEGSPTWSFTLTSDDVNECLQLEVIGSNSETVQWRATAFYRVV